MTNSHTAVEHLDYSRLVDGEPCYRCGKVISARLSHICDPKLLARRADAPHGEQEPWKGEYDRLKQPVHASQFAIGEAYNQGVWDTLKALALNNLQAPVSETVAPKGQHLANDLNEAIHLLRGLADIVLATRPEAFEGWASAPYKKAQDAADFINRPRSVFPPSASPCVVVPMELLMRLKKWNLEFPKGRIYNATEHKAGEAELDHIIDGLLNMVPSSPSERNGE